MSLLGKRNRDVDFSNLPTDVLKIVMDKRMGKPSYWRGMMDASITQFDGNRPPLVNAYSRMNGPVAAAEAYQHTRIGTAMYNIHVDHTLAQWVCIKLNARLNSLVSQLSQQ